MTASPTLPAAHTSPRPLAGRVALVTGSVRRIGRATALALSDLGADLVITARSSAAEAQAVADEIAQRGGRALVHMADLMDEAAVAGLVAETVERFGGLDILVNNASLRIDRPLLEMSLAEWRQINGVILDGAFLCSRAAIPHMLARSFGRIVNIGGISAHVGAPNRAHVVTAKAGIVGFTRALAHEFAEDGITVNCVVPGKIGGTRSATSGKGIHGDPLVPRLGVPEDVARTVAHLCMPEADYITGQTLHVSGGMYIP
jgi:3-oxoacyl-[acyl-carrier protein] reductase